MKFKAITTVSAIALMMSLPAFAADYTTGAADAPVNPPTAAKDGPVMDNAKEDLSDKAGDMASDIKAFFIGKTGTGKLEPVMIHRSMTAHGMIGETVINSRNENVASVKDIIIGKNGQAILVVVSNSGVLGIGSKVAAFDYGKVVGQQPDGKVVMTLTEDMVDHAKDFSYDQKDWAKAKVIPSGSISVNELLKGDVLDNTGKKLASVENVYLRNGDVSQIIVGFNKTLGMGGDLAAIDYDSMQLVRKNGSLDFRLNASQSREFRNFKKTASN